MSFIVAGCVLLLGLLAGIVLDDISVRPLSELTLKNSRHAVCLPGGRSSGGSPVHSGAKAGQVVEVGQQRGGRNL